MVLTCLSALVSSGCFEPAEPLPAPHLNPGSPDLVRLFSGLETVIETALTQTTASWNTTITSHAIDVTSANETLWQSFHTAPLLGEYDDGGPTNVTGDTAFRIASLSKVFTVLAILLEQQKGNLNMKDPVTKYLLDLRENDIPDGVQWEQISLESLASQLSGIPREYGQEDFADGIVARNHGIANLQGAGLPPVHADDLATCGTNHETSPTCFRKDIIEGSKKRPPVFPPNYKSTYSNIAFILLGFVLENVTGKSYQEALSASILEPLDMHHTTVERPKDSMGVIPAMTNDWTYIAGAYDPTGGLYSTVNDLSIFMRAILNSELLDRSTTNAWFKPRSWSSSLHSAYGMPWEIYRTTGLIPDSDRGVTLITKGGALYGYYSHIILLPEFDLAITVLVAGESEGREWLEKQVLTATTKLVEDIARSQARDRYTGYYKSLQINSSITFEINGSSGLTITSWISNGTDFMLEYVGIHTGQRDLSQGRIQLVPAGLRRRSGGEAWHATFVPNKRTADSVIDSCMINDVDTVMYGDRSLQEFVFHANNEGEVTEVELPAFRAVLRKHPKAEAMVRPAGCSRWNYFQQILGLSVSTGCVQK
ncbi:MAG: hypothetical protein Q9195_005182 [Heterodermia aff. obscurata]